MKITNEIKAKVFAQYLYQEMIADDAKMQFIGSSCSDNEPYLIGFNNNHGDGDFDPDSCKLILKPLSSITDKDARGIKILGTEDKMEYKDAKHFLEFYKAVEFLTSMGADFLRNLGYDVPHYLLGGKTLQESGLAIYE